MKKLLITILVLSSMVLPITADNNELWITHGQRKIYGVLSVPEGVAKKKVAIISHGFNGTHHFGRDYFLTLNKQGYEVYTFDFPYGSVNSKSDNNTMNMSILDQKNDLKAIVRYFQAQPDVDKDSIILIGESQGGLVSALAAADLKDEVRRLILIYPALCIPDNWNKRYPKVCDIPDTTLLWKVPLGRRFFKEIRHLKPLKAITKYQGPVLIIHGSQDKVVPVDYSEQAMKNYRQAHLYILRGAGHGFTPKQRQESKAIIKEFLEK